MSSIVTLTSDFGESDGYLAAVKGTLLRLVPDVRMVDISHAIALCDVMQAAFVVRQAAQFFPPGTIHLIAVDTAVHPLVAARHGDRYFVAPDNGVLSLVLDDPPQTIVQLSAGPSRSAFPAVALLAPAAGRLAAGTAIEQLGPPQESLRPMHWPLPIEDEQGLRGWVVHVDHAGNCITNISRSMLGRYGSNLRFKCYAGQAMIERVHDTYEETPGEPTAVFNSQDVLEIAVVRGNASELMSIRTGSPVNLVMLENRD